MVWLPRVGALCAGFVACALVVWHASYSAFSGVTANPTNNWAAGSVALSDNDSDTAMFTLTNLKPGQAGSNCITVTYTGSLPATVKLYGTAYSTTNGMATYLDLVITQGSGGGFGNCSGFTPQGSVGDVYNAKFSGFGPSRTNFSNGAGNWTTTGSGNESRVFNIYWALDTPSPNSVQNGTVQLGFTWEAQNT